MLILVRNLVSPCIKFHLLTDVLRDPEDNNDIMQMLREAHQLHKKIGCLHAAGHLRMKGIKAKQVRSRLISKKY